MIGRDTAFHLDFTLIQFQYYWISLSLHEGVGEGGGERNELDLSGNEFYLCVIYGPNGTFDSEFPKGNVLWA